MIKFIDNRYFRCNKCGSISVVENSRQMNNMCTSYAGYRTSGICGGSFSIEMTEEEYKAQLQEWENKKDEKDV